MLGKINDIKLKVPDLNSKNERESVIIDLNNSYEDHFRKFMEVIIKKTYNGLDEDNFVKELDIIPYFRGFSVNEIERENLNTFYKKFFVVGEKGRYSRGQIFNGKYYSLGDEKNKVTDSELEDTIIEYNKIVKKPEQKINYQMLMKYKRRKGYSNEKIYIMIMNIQHNIGNRWKNKEISPFVSVSYGETGFNTALDFAKNERGKKNKGSRTKDSDETKYIIWAYTRNKDRRKYLFTKDINNFLENLGIEWYEDRHTEILIKDCIYPHNIFGVFEVSGEADELTLIINPYLIAMFTNVSNFQELDYKKILETLENKNIPVKQLDFKKYAKELGHNKYYVDYGEEKDSMYSLKDDKYQLVPGSYYNHK